MICPPPRSTLFPYTTLFRSQLTDNSIVSATLDIRYAVDNAINGVFINGQRISGNSFDGDYHSEFRFVRRDVAPLRSEEHTSELQSHSDLVCRLLLEKKKNNH